MLQASELCCDRGDRRLFEGLGFTLASGEALHISGRNGSGKTTLLRLMAGLTVPTEGELRWKGQTIQSLKEEFSAQICYLGHLNGLKAELTALENLAAAAAINGLLSDPDRHWQALERMGLRGYEDLPTKVLSQGQKRRVALARLLLSTASLWILDEPFVALDTAAVSELQDILTDHVAGGGMLALTTHQAFSLRHGQLRELRLGEVTR